MLSIGPVLAEASDRWESWLNRRSHIDLGKCSCGAPLIEARGIGPVCVNAECPIVDGPFSEEKEQP